MVDASELISRLRVTKSPAELAYVERAAELADAALTEARESAKPCADESDILAAMQDAVFRGGGDYAGNEFITGSGKDALLGRYFSGRRRLDPDDQMTLEFAGAYRRYHACLMRTICIGRILDRQRDMWHACYEAPLAAMDALKPGFPIGQVFDAMPAFSMALDFDSIGSMPAATASARSTTPIGWSGRCSIPAIRCWPRRTWCSSCT